MRKEIPLWEIKRNSVPEILLAQEKHKHLAPLLEVFIKTCIENGCKGEDLLKIGGDMWFNTALLMIKKEIPQDKVMAHMDEIYSCVKRAFGKYENS